MYVMFISSLAAEVLPCLPMDEFENSALL